MVPGWNMQAGAQSLRGALSPTRSALKLRSMIAKSGMGPDHGAGYPVTPYPPIKVPAEAPCVDQLFTPNTPPLQAGQLPVGDFSDYSDHPFNYTPPSGCPGPYAKIVFKMHFRVTAGVQYDRTGAVWIGATNVFFGTTSEPGSSSSPQWNVERDVTDYVDFTGPGNSFITTSGPVLAAATVVDGPAALSMQGAGTLEIDAAPSLGDGTAVNVGAGTLRFNVTSGSATVGVASGGFFPSGTNSIFAKTTA